MAAEVVVEGWEAASRDVGGTLPSTLTSTWSSGCTPTGWDKRPQGMYLCSALQSPRPRTPRHLLELL